MKLPGFNADASLSQSQGLYRRSPFPTGRDAAEVLPVLGKTCSNCETVGGFGSIRGAGRRSCCEQVRNPLTKRVETNCWFESCTPERAKSGLLSF
jgi:hypothetical protein